MKKPLVTRANSTPIRNRKEWRPRISGFDRLGNHHSSRQQVATKKSVFQRLDFNHNVRTSMENSLIPKKSVFDRLDFDLQHAAQAKNMDNSQPRRRTQITPIMVTRFMLTDQITLTILGRHLGWRRFKFPIMRVIRQENFPNVCAVYGWTIGTLNCVH
jgi:hypothetical protein